MAENNIYHLSFHHLIRLLFWSDWEDNDPRLERALMDGSNRQRIKTSGLKFPNGLAIDFKGQRLFWCDAGTDKIGSLRFDGTSQEIHFRLGDAHPFDLGLYEDTLFWSDWKKKGISKGFKNGTNKMVLKQDTEVLYGVKVFAKENQLGDDIVLK